MEFVSISNDTVKRLIQDMSSNVLSQETENVNNSLVFSLQPDESTDIASDAQLLVYVCYIDDKKFTEDFLFCKALECHVTGENMFNLLNEFMSVNLITWSRCV